MCPFCAAIKTGVTPPLLDISKSAPPTSTSSVTVEVCPFEAAAKSGVMLALFAVVTLPKIRWDYFVLAYKILLVLQLQ